MYLFSQIDAEQQNRILSLIESGKKQGAKLVAGGGRGSDTGYFVQPTVFSDVKDHMDIATTEVWEHGPIHYCKRKDVKFQNSKSLVLWFTRILLWAHEILLGE